MRCQKCGYGNQEDHRFCGMCGAKLEGAASAVAIDDEDPLGLEASELDGRSQSAQLVRERPREATRDLRSGISGGTRAKSTSIGLDDFPPDTAQEEAVREARRRRSADASTAISGPSFLGLGNEASNSGFVYDNPDDGFIYDTPSDTPEYLLTEVSRGPSWRAWALFLLLLIAAGLGYIQWRASHNQGPDIAAILAGNGATVSPSGPKMSGNNAQPATPKPAAQTDESKSDNADATASADASDDHSSSAKSADASVTKTGSDSANASDRSNTKSYAKAADSKATPKNDDDDEDASKTASAPAKTVKAKASDEDSEESAKPESDEPVSKATKHAKRESIEEKPQPKTLGEKDPLLVQADKYIQGRGVRQNCSAGVNLLRQAVSEGNPEASVKLGALYWSGTCVTQSKVAAYEWFSRAHSLEPRNRWIERSRNSLWANMSPSERQRVGY